MSLPAVTGLGVALLVTVTCAPVTGPTTVLTDAVLLLEFESLAEELTDAVSLMTVRFATPVFTFVTKVNVAAVDPAMSRFVHTTLPELPTPGLMQLHPAGAEIETKVVLLGTVATRVALSAALGPLFVTTCV